MALETTVYRRKPTYNKGRRPESIGGASERRHGSRVRREPDALWRRVGSPHHLPPRRDSPFRAGFPSNGP